jgi:hypothetical protein
MGASDWAGRFAQGTGDGVGDSEILRECARTRVEND